MFTHCGFTANLKIVPESLFSMTWDSTISKIHDFLWKIDTNAHNEMNVPVHIYGSQQIVNQMRRDDTFTQAINVARLPGIVKQACVLPDGHQGYGFPIGGAAAFSLEEGIISPGGVGYDINCGIRLITTPLTFTDIKPHLKELLQKLFHNVPSGVGSKSKLHVGYNELDNVLTMGSKWAVEHGYGVEDDLTHTEEGGCMKDANASAVSERAHKRGFSQLGTLGAGNHFLEVQKVSEIFNPEVAKLYGVNKEDQIVIMLHCGSRGLGHQVCSDYIKIMLAAAEKYNIKLPDKELACAPLQSKEAESYLGAMYAAVNYAFCNRQVMTQWVRDVFSSVFGDIKMPLIYDVCHNIAKIENHNIDGKNSQLCVHRKGCTRAFGPGRSELPPKYIDTGQPVIIPGDMGTSSYVLRGTQKAMDETFGTANHGAGRVMSRTKAKKTYYGSDVRESLNRKGIYVKATSPAVISEEAPNAYKDISQVIESVHNAGICEKIVKTTPILVTKG